jgi:uncharacterized protein (TIGR03435 family)
MKRIFQCLGCAALLAGNALSQSAFEAADVHASPKTRNQFMRGPFTRNGLYEIRIANMVDLIRTAYGIEEDKVIGGPNWLEMDRFDVTAKLPANSTADTRKTMLQALLADRFKLVVHKDTRTIPGYELTAGKRQALKKSVGEGPSECKFLPPDPPTPGGPPTVPFFAYSCHNMTTAAFAGGMFNMAATFQYLNGQTVVDKTDLPGAWDFDFKYSPRGAPFGSAGDTITFFDAIDKQLGLKLEPAKLPMPVTVVDSVNRKPTDNAPGVVESMHIPQPPTEFEVADLKLTPPDFKGVRFQILPGGKVDLKGATLKILIQQAWNLTDDTLVGAPKWLDADRYDIIAKAPVYEGQIDFDEVMVMIRAFLADRFKLAVHMEERPISAYMLTAVKPKMKKADPVSRTRFQEGPALDGKDPRNSNPVLSRLLTCQNVTMAQFAEQLQDLANGYVHAPVLDATNLEGGWDFTLSFSPIGVFMNGRGGPSAPPASPDAPASDPNGAVTLPDAVQKQLGLKLELQKRPIPVLVIDRIEQKPTDN